MRSRRLSLSARRMAREVGARKGLRQQNPKRRDLAGKNLRQMSEFFLVKAGRRPCRDPAWFNTKAGSCKRSQLLSFELVRRVTVSDVRVILFRLDLAEASPFISCALLCRVYGSSVL